MTQISRNLPPPNFLVGHREGTFQDKGLWALDAGLYPTLSDSSVGLVLSFFELPFLLGKQSQGLIPF